MLRDPVVAHRADLRTRLRAPSAKRRHGTDRRRRKNREQQPPHGQGSRKVSARTTDEIDKIGPCIADRHDP